jgi:hypothetical protein
VVQEYLPDDADGVAADDEVAVGAEGPVADEVAMGDVDVRVGLGEGETVGDDDVAGVGVVGDGAAEVCGADGEVAVADGEAEANVCDGDGDVTGPFRGPQAMTPHPVRTASAAFRRVLPIRSSFRLGSCDCHRHPRRPRYQRVIISSILFSKT